MSADKSDDDKLGNKQYSGENKHKTHIFYRMLASYLQPLSNENYSIYNLEMFNHHFCKFKGPGRLETSLLSTEYPGI